MRRSLLAEVEPNLVPERVGELNVGACIEGVYPEEQLGATSRMSRLGFVNADRHLVAHSEAANVPSLFEHDGKTQALGVERTHVVEHVPRHLA